MESMAGLDAKFLYSETPTTHMHTIKVVVSNVSDMPGGFAYDGLVDALRQQLGRLPPFRRRFVSVPLSLGHPVWVEDPDFDLANHVSYRSLASPATMRELAGEIADIAGKPLPRDRPLWEMVIVDGIEGGRMAVVAKVHHAVADGLATVALLQNVVEGVDESLTEPPVDTWEPESIPATVPLLKGAMRAHGVRIRGLPRLVVDSVKGARESESRRRNLELKPPLPLQTPRTSLNVSLDGRRTFAMTTLPLGDLQAIRRVAGTTLNDVYLAVCSGALRRYLIANGELPSRSLVASVPLSTDPNVARMSGNRIDSLYVTLGTDIADPLQRLMHCSAVATGAKQVRSALGNSLLERRAEVVPPQLYKAAVRIWGRSHLANRVRPPINVILSNVAGPRSPVRFGPSEMEALYSVGPLIEGVGLNVTAWSYVDSLHVSVLGCPASLPDPWRIADALGESLAELTESVVNRPAPDKVGHMPARDAPT